MIDPIEIILPLPVTVNNLTCNNTTGNMARSKTREAKQWLKNARVAIAPYIRKYNDYCDSNIRAMYKYKKPGKKSYDLHAMHSDNPLLSYCVEYTYFFPNERGKRPRDIFNYEKQLSDFLVEYGFMLDDSFIDHGTVKLGEVDKTNPRVEVLIKKNEDSNG